MSQVVVLFVAKGDGVVLSRGAILLGYEVALAASMM
jgi:hypothetical protein